MKFTRTEIDDLWLIELEPHEDERGFLARTYCEEEFAKHGLNTKWPQCNLTLTKKVGTIRGMHWQAEPKSEIKIVRCVSGKVWDCVVDVRHDSLTFGKWQAFELSAENGHSLYIGAGLAHGFQVLEPNSVLYYHMSKPYEPALACGVRYDDTDMAITWPLTKRSLSQRDSKLPFLKQIK